MAQLDRKYSLSGQAFSGEPLSENVLPFASPDTSNHGVSALKLVYQAAEAFGEMQDRAMATEARAKALCESATERVVLANQRAENAERERETLLAHVELKLQEVSQALDTARARIAAAEEKVTAAEQRAYAAETHAQAAETRAQAAEARAQDTKQALALVEDALRKRLLSRQFDFRDASAVA
jgi:hypothetical protein